MRPILQIMFEAGTATLIVAMGVFGSLAILLIAIRHYQRTHATVSKLLELALSGRSDEARIHARGESSELAPFLDTLGGVLDAPKAPAPVRDVMLIALLSTPLMFLAFYGMGAVHGAPDTKLSAAAGVLVGVAILLPVWFATAFATIALSRSAQRIVRGSCITLLARNVKAAVEQETAESLRRGGPSPPARDPRGE